ncbi:hypothetical protein BD324DRAFT_681411 [Kockovaella imperatae]|uniref:Peptidase M20 dimerisation domain-containing protein n=1 Tax=Kockovaella imperatae TaxID=4999 RepID=A0A1Y1UGI1_9TREE|nr:hypothetical protein BD324DRAFT_681411 [Kockovaella imperatae]ORX36637.1 hypothetical protein BD324DRAFT_681411 [Kockovaella imperatae]
MAEKHPSYHNLPDRTPIRQRGGLGLSSTVLLAAVVFLLGNSLPKISWISIPGVSEALNKEPSTKYSVSDLTAAKCPPQPPLLDKGSDWNPMTDDAFIELASKRLSKAVQIDTVSFDNMPMDASDSAFDKHYKLSEWLESEYPNLFKAPLKHEYVNTHGHLFTWEGTDSKLKPILLMAHTDTVPVLPATLDQWTFEPWSGRIESDVLPDTPGKWIWGRGSSDCKNQLLGTFNAVERLVQEGYKPERTILIANGFDEEVGGFRGAQSISKVMQDRYGPNSIAFALDEGFSGISTEYGASVASFGMAEKGAINVVIRVENPGGHSSVPPEHTGIGVMSLILTALEAHPFRPELNPMGPFIKHLSCLADLAPDAPSKLKKDLKNPKKWDKMARDLAGGDRIMNSYLATTQAIDIIGGGVKINALPEYVEAQVNSRISFTSSVDETLEHLVEIIKPVVDSLNYTFSPFDNSRKSSIRHVSLELDGRGRLEPAPITSAEDPSFELMGGTTKAVFGKDTLITPTGMYANTDTRMMWNLTTNLYRFTPSVMSDFHVHTVDERMPLDGHLNTTRFIYKLIKNSEGWRD